MKTIVGDLWDQNEGWIVIPTNLSTNKFGEAVMGRGSAQQAAEKFPGLAAKYGRVLKWSTANKVMFDTASHVICLPVKRKWNDKADMSLIADSLRLLVLGMNVSDQIFLPLIGCGFGELNPKDVMPLLEALDDRFTLVLRSDDVVKKYPASFKASALRKDKLHNLTPP